MKYYHVKDLEPREMAPGFTGRMIHSDRMTVVYWEIEAGSQLPEHSHPEEMIVNVLEGRLELTVEGETRMLEPRDVVVIPSDVPHAARAETYCRVLDVWNPPREDYK